MTTRELPQSTAQRSSLRGKTSLLAAISLLLFAAGASQGSAQENSSAGTDATFGELVKVEVVNVEVVVTDRAGQPVVGLAREDFELKVDGKPTPITNFYSDARPLSTVVTTETGRAAPNREADDGFQGLREVEAGAARRSHVVLLIDHTRLSAPNRKRAFEALRQALDRLDADALVSVVGIEGGLVFYSDFLFDHQAVHRVLDNVSKVALQTDISEAERRMIFGELARGISGGIQARASLANDSLMISRIQAYASQEYARGVQSLQMIESVAGTLGGLPGRKLLIYLGEGVPTRPGEGLYVEYRNRFAGEERGLPHQDYNNDYTKAVGRFDLTQPMQELARSVNRAGVTLYAIDAEGNHGNSIRSALTEQGATSEAISVVTENYREPLEYASKATGGRLLESSGKLAEQLVEMFEGLQTYYSLGFTPPVDWRRGSAHDLRVDVKMKGLRVSHREEVTLPESNEREAGATIAALMYQTVDNRLGIRAQPGTPATRADGAVVLPVNIEIPIEKLELIPREGQHAGSLTIYVSSKDAKGNPGSVQKIPFHLAIPDDKVEQARGDAAHYPLPLILRPGDRQVAIGIRDDVSGVFSALRLEVGEFSPPL